MFTKINQQIINGSLLRRRSYGSSRNISSPTRKERLGKKDCVTSHKNACVGGYINAGSLDFDNTNFSLSGVDVTNSSVKNNLEISWVKTKKIEWKGCSRKIPFFRFLLSLANSLQNSTPSTQQEANIWFPHPTPFRSIFGSSGKLLANAQSEKYNWLNRRPSERANSVLCTVNKSVLSQCGIPLL